MLQGIRASTLTMPPFGHEMSHSGIQKTDGYGDTDAWVWPQPTTTTQPPYSQAFDPSAYTAYSAHLQPSVPRLPPRHQSVPAPHELSTGSTVPPPPRSQAPPNMVKAQPAFKPTWQGFLDTTKDAMTVVEAALQGRLSHISRRPHDKERTEMLTSGTVLVYEENASGIKRWTDAVHWSPSRVMNNCLIYRQLVRALKPEEKKTALNPSCGTKRKRKESAGPATSKTGENLNNSEDEYENSAFDAVQAGEGDPLNKVYANFAQSLNPDQQRRFCGSLIDSYEFKEGGLMKKTISVKYQGTHHHVISYYSLEDVVSGKLKRPFQDSRLVDIQPRPELLSGWKVSLEDEETKDMPLVGGYSQHIQPSHVQHHVIGPHSAVSSHPPLHLHLPEYWQSHHGSQYAASHHSPQHYASPQSATAHYPTPQAAHQYSTPQPHPHSYTPQPPVQYGQSPSPQQRYSPTQTSSPHYPAHTSVPPQYSVQSHQPRHYSYDQPHLPAPQYSQPPASAQYPSGHQTQISQPPSYAIPQATSFEPSVPVAPGANATQPQNMSPAPREDSQRRASAPVTLQTYGPTHFTSPPHPQSYYVTDQKYAPGSQSHGF